MPSISEGKTCKTTNDSGQMESYYKKEFWWDNIHLDPMNSMVSVLYKTKFCILTRYNLKTKL